MVAVDLAWAAGIFEGEGCIYQYRGRGYQYPRLKVGMTDEDIVRRFHEIVGCGSVTRFNSPAHEKRGNKPVWVWTAGRTEDVARVAGMLWPWLGERRRAKAVEVLDAPRKVA